MQACGRLVARMGEQDVDRDIATGLDIDGTDMALAMGDLDDPAIDDRYVAARQIGPNIGRDVVTVGEDSQIVGLVIVYFRQHICAPPAMNDTFFALPAEKQAWLAALYVGNIKEPLRPGLRRADNLPYEGAYMGSDLPHWPDLLRALREDLRPANKGQHV